MLIETFLPERIVKNSDLEKIFPEWVANRIKQKVGIVSRHIATTEETVLDLEDHAYRKLFFGHSENALFGCLSSFLYI